MERLASPSSRCRSPNPQRVCGQNHSDKDVSPHCVATASLPDVTSGKTQKVIPVVLELGDGVADI
ncbi:MAG: hypothetical protein PVI92_00300, partial [Chromatiales bacterium]